MKTERPTYRPDVPKRELTSLDRQARREGEAIRTLKGWTRRQWNRKTTARL